MSAARACAAVLLCAALAHSRPAPAAMAANVIPAPLQVSQQAGGFILSPDTVIVTGTDAAAKDSGAYLGEQLRILPGLTLAVRPEAFGPAGAHAVVLHLAPELPELGAEGYELEVSPHGVAVTAHAAAGLFYGVVTLWQLCSAAPRPDGDPVVPALRIRDLPRFRWRGLMLDSARHFQSPAFIMQYLDWMALHKLNVLGWHLSDDQGWRLQIRRYPRLTSIGAWRVPAGRAAQRDIDPATGRPRLYGGFYSQQDVRRIVAHAAARHVMLVPEIDLPGHASAAIAAYPALGVEGVRLAAVPADWGLYPNLFNVEESTFTFLENVLHEVLTLFPGPFVHLGGDEAVKEQWRTSARVQARMRALGVGNEQALQGYFTGRLAKYLAAHGRRAVGWDEILAGGAPAQAVVMSWRGVEGAIAAAAAGHDTVLSPAPTLYLDNRQGGGPDEPPGRGRIVSLEEVYRFEPLPGALSRAPQHVLGLQANLWTEHVRTEERAAYMTWPRAAALAEAGWSAPAQRDFADFLKRLPAEFDRYRALGVRYSADALAPARHLGPLEPHMSQDLAPCSDKVLLNVEDDAPRAGPRAVFLVDIENPCWRMPADLAHGAHLSAAVGQVPFNFQIGSARAAIALSAPHSASGELEVRLDQCQGEPAAVLSLAPALDNDAVTQLPAVALPAISGSHELCLRFAQHGLDPLWVIAWLQLAP
jgi:hexosaminidase